MCFLKCGSLSHSSRQEERPPNRSLAQGFEPPRCVRPLTRPPFQTLPSYPTWGCLTCPTWSGTARVTTPLRPRSLRRMRFSISLTLPVGPHFRTVSPGDGRRSKFYSYSVSQLTEYHTNMANHSVILQRKTAMERKWLEQATRNQTKAAAAEALEPLRNNRQQNTQRPKPAGLWNCEGGRAGSRMRK